jgi:hypothetical protein
MVSPVKQVPMRRPTPAMRRAHRLVASLLFNPATQPDRAARVPAWKAWWFAGWLTLVAIAYGAWLAVSLF